MRPFLGMLQFFLALFFVADMEQRPGNSYVIVNPPPEFELKAGDIM